jgi:hypothetical protein
MVAVYLMLVFVLGAPKLGLALQNNIDFDGLRCKLPGWPGHPAPTCDPNTPEQCCAGTKCAPDPYDPNHATCQQTELFTVAEHALTASVLTSHVRFLVNSALDQLESASLGLYLSRPEQRLQDEVIVGRAKILSSNHGNVKGEKSSKPADDWHKLTHESQPAANGPNAGKTVQASEPSNEAMNKAKKDDKAPSGQQQQGGFDYSKYIPKQTDADSKKKDSKKSKEAEHQPHKGGSGFDYSPYYHAEPHPDSGKPDKAKSKEHADAHGSPQAGGNYDYSQYMPTQKHIQQPTDASADDDFLKNAALQLLQADLQLRASSSQAKREILERVRAILNELNDIVERQLQNSPQAEASDSSSVNADRLPDDEVGDANHGSSVYPATLAPTVVWDDETDFWRKYIPDMPNQRVNAGDRRPGSLGGPCGQTTYKDFGECLDKKQTCVGLGPNKPGICQLKRTTIAQYSRQSALNTLKLAEEAVASIQAATVELLVASTTPSLDEDEQQVMPSTISANGENLALNMSDSPLNLRGYSPSTLFVVVLGFGVIGYFCWIKGMGKRRSYNTIDGWGAAGERA